ncbi:MAG TPA: sensor domain-containing protein [Anaerolineaceae bacterium]|nr:sensor domain-containing protein [Anaerolineaceae bacterium]
MNQRHPLERYFGVFAEAKSYTNLLYLLLAFPLGVAYFVFLITGFAAGIPLIIIWVGLLILMLVFALSWVFTAFERWLAISLLRVDIPPMSRPSSVETGFWSRMREYLTNPVTWKGLLFLALKFPIGLFTFVVTITGLSIALGFITSPFIYSFADIGVGFWQIDTFTEAAVAAVVGVMILPAMLHLFNWIAYWLGRFARYMLGIQSPAAPAAYPPAVRQSESNPAEAQNYEI